MIRATVRQAGQSVARHAAGPDPAQWVPIGAFQRVGNELNRVNQGVLLAAATAAVEQEIERGRLPPFLREWGITLCSVNKPAFDAFMHKTGPSVHRLFEPGPAVGSPRRTAAESGGLTDEELAVCRAMGHDPAA